MQVHVLEWVLCRMHRARARLAAPDSGGVVALVVGALGGRPMSAHVSPCQPSGTQRAGGGRLTTGVTPIPFDRYSIDAPAFLQRFL